MKYSSLLVLTLLCAGLTALGHDPNRPKSPQDIKSEGRYERALWVWAEKNSNLTKKIIEDANEEGERKKFFEFCAKPFDDEKNAINTVYFSFRYFDKDWKNLFQEQPQLVKDFIRSATRHRVKIFYLISLNETEFTALLDAKLQEKEPEMVRYSDIFMQASLVLSYNTMANPTERIAGLDLNIECKLADFNKYLFVLTELRKQLKGNDFFELRADTRNFWEDEKQHFTSKILPLVDSINVIAYHDTTDEIIRLCRDEIAAGTREKKKVFIGVQTADMSPYTPANPSTITFYQEGRKKMEETITKVAETFKEEKYFAGFAIHHYESYRDLPVNERKAEEEAQPDANPQPDTNPPQEVAPTPEPAPVPDLKAKPEMTPQPLTPPKPVAKP